MLKNCRGAQCTFGLGMQNKKLIFYNNMENNMSSNTEITLCIDDVTNNLVNVEMYEISEYVFHRFYITYTF